MRVSECGGVVVMVLMENGWEWFEGRLSKQVGSSQESKHNYKHYSYKGFIAIHKKRKKGDVYF
jgi:hypothetical protein